MALAGGDVHSPFSQFVDKAKIPQDWPVRPATPSTVTSVGMLPHSQGKKSIKSLLRERLFPPSHDIRSVLFKSLIKRIPHNASLFSPTMLKDFTDECFPKISKAEDVPLPSFLKSVDDIPNYYLNSQGCFELRKILLCINHYFPQIVYCPILPPIIALLLHYDDSPDQVFVHTCHLIFNSIRTINYIDQSEAEAEVSVEILKEFVVKFAQTSHKTLTSLTHNPNDIYNQWLKVLFHGLPFSYLVVVCDMFLVDGYKALFRVAIALLKFYKKIGFSNPSDILSAVYQFVSNIDSKVSANLLFRKAYGIKLPPTKEIRKLYQKRLASMQFPTSSQNEVSEHQQSWKFIYLVRNVTSGILNETMFTKLYCWLPERISTLRPTRIFSTADSGYNMDTLFRATDDREPTLLVIKTTNDYIIGAYLTADWSERSSSSKSFFGTGETFIFTLHPEEKKFSWIGVGDKQIKDAETRSNDGKLSACSSLTSDHLKNTVPGSRNSRGVSLPLIRKNSSVMSANRVGSRENFVLPRIAVSPILKDCSPSASILNAADSSSSVKIHTKPSEDILNKNGTDLFMYTDEKGVIIGGGTSFGIFLDRSFLNCSTDKCDTFANDPLVPDGKFVCACVEVFGFTE